MVAECFIGKCGLYRAGLGAIAYLASTHVMADSPLREIVRDRTEYVDAASAFDSYSVYGTGYLHSDGAAIKHIYSYGGRTELTGNTLVKDGMLSDRDARALVKDSTILSDRTVALIVQGNSNVTLEHSVVEGKGGGITVVEDASALISNTQVSSLQDEVGRHTGWGVGIFGARADITSRSYIKGLSHGVWFTHPGLTVGDGTQFNHGQLSIDNSTVEGLTGAAIRVEGREGISHLADIEIKNNTLLLSGNGMLLEVLNQSTANFNVDNSSLNGNLVADDTSTLNITLQNGAQLNGNIVNGNRLAITSGSHWQMQGDNAVRSLSLHGGRVSFAGEGFHTLSLNELSGGGTFGLRVDLDNGFGDLIDVNGQASGQFGLRVRNTGEEIVSADMAPLKVVHTEGGDAQFSLLGGRVDLGAYSYLLEQQGNDWFIVGKDKVISPSTQSALALYSAAPAIWMSELSTLRSRMGEVRASGRAGGWMRAYGNRLNATTSDGVDYRQKQSGLSLGADAPVEVSNGQLVVGVLGGYSTSGIDLSRGTTGKVDSYYAGAYATWLLDEGYYVDGVLKLNRFRNKADVAMSDASKAKGDYTNNGVGGWVEFGRHIKLADDYFLEPFAQLSSVVVQGQELRLDNGMKAKNDQTQSVLGKVGTSLGRSVALKDGGVLQPYVRVAVAQEFSRRNEVKANDVKFDNSLFGSRGELGAGVSVSLSERMKLHADFDYMKGRHIEQPWGANVGLRLAF
ncbi:Outer membrane autotransporter barrel [Pseudomonas syringae pv. pisi]|uniref:Outer membrane autotransporter barrel n=3 Tax=Pseudomonas TaxID=286 RepID=A0A3M3U3Y5_PSESJ|nr:Outer membrane autotransporter barrel [Pseudomonas syringae pv. pisi]RML66111.1 Outer membrane autotransporter barrel [Pseudomonas syringae pv. pisi]RMO27884.1 Outer membrane autotransporter barrel [Pseudomonas syringae pv. pisi]RMU89245.1 Outer membrane autotransporter barrel [Pseudomonas savastanoi pv. phaseolicola]